jgi:hypothetical protein
MSSIGVLLGKQHSSHDVFMQIAGAARRIRADILCNADEHSITLHRVLMQGVNTLYEQVGQTAMPNGRSRTELRLARWLLMSHDRVEGEGVKRGRITLLDRWRIEAKCKGIYEPLTEN